MLEFEVVLLVVDGDDDLDVEQLGCRPRGEGGHRRSSCRLMARTIAGAGSAPPHGTVKAFLSLAGRRLGGAELQDDRRPGRESGRDRHRPAGSLGAAPGDVETEPGRPAVAATADRFRDGDARAVVGDLQAGAAAVARLQPHGRSGVPSGVWATTFSSSASTAAARSSADGADGERDGREHDRARPPCSSVSADQNATRSPTTVGGVAGRQAALPLRAPRGVDDRGEHALQAPA